MRRQVLVLYFVLMPPHFNRLIPNHNIIRGELFNSVYQVSTSGPSNDTHTPTHTHTLTLFLDDQFCTMNVSTPSCDITANSRQNDPIRTSAFIAFHAFLLPICSNLFYANTHTRTQLAFNSNQDGH